MVKMLLSSTKPTIESPIDALPRKDPSIRLINNPTINAKDIPTVPGDDKIQ
jgi:hypothetical protein